MSRDKPIPGLMTDAEFRFCDMLISSGDLELSYATIFGVSDDLAFSVEAAAHALLSKPAIQDYMEMMSRGDTTDLEDTIRKLEAMRREAWRRGNMSEVRSAQMEIAKLRGWMVQRTENKNLSAVISGDVRDLPSDKLVDLLSRPESEELLAKRGLKYEDGRIVSMKTLDGDAERVVINIEEDGDE